MKIRTLTPVHVFDGNINFRLLYKENDGFLQKYNELDLYANLSDERLLDEKMLNIISSKQTSKRDFNRFLGNEDIFKDLEPEYKLSLNGAYHSNQDIQSQYKTFEKPYIPGSSIKGTIITAIAFKFLRKHEKTMFANFPEFVRNIKKEPLLVDLINSVTKEPGNQWFKDFSSFIICDDVYFDDLSIMSSKRIGSSDRGDGMPLFSKECISVNAVAIEDFVKIDKRRISNLSNSYLRNPLVKEFFEYLDINKILFSIDEYSRYMLEFDLTPVSVDFYTEYNCDDAVNELNEIKENKNILLRIGNSTNYWFKSISYLFFNDNYSLFEEYFEKVFSPIKINKNKKNQKRPFADSIPKTSTILVDGSGNNHFAGYLELINE